MKIVQATRSFESWLGKSVRIVPADIAYKHEQMRADPFLYFRATFYRWCQLWLNSSRKLVRAAATNTVGDLHLENFGTWRDAEGRLIWGVNDFDEAYPMAFTNDLVRLTVSAFLAADSNPAFDFKRATICKEILAGYHEMIEKGGDPYVLMERHPLLRAMAVQDLRQPPEFWKRLQEKVTPISARKVPSSVRAAIASISPKMEFQMCELRSPKGLGSLGRQRFLAMGHWEGGWLAREAKSVAPSALLWAEGGKPGCGNPHLNEIVKQAVRGEDPHYRVRKGWLVRRLGPDCSRIDIDELSRHHDRALLLRCMGGETANIHLGGKKARRRILADLHSLPDDWLFHAAEKLHEQTLADWKKFRRR